MFNIGDRGFLTAEYFGYDDADAPIATIEPNAHDVHLVMDATKVVVPIWHIRPNHKGRTMYSGISMPAIAAYELDIHGWLGSSQGTRMPMASITLTNLPDLHLPRTTLPAPDEERDSFTMKGATSRNAVLTLEAGGWTINLGESRANLGNENARVHRAALRKQDGSLFTLSESDVDCAILDALLKFLSFQSGRWITKSTILCAPVDPRDGFVERAWTGQLTHFRNQHHSSWTAADWMNWPKLFQEFWRHYTDEKIRQHLIHAVHHYVEQQQVFYDGTIDYALVAAQSTLQALTRWWNDLCPDYRFGPPGPTFEDLLLKAVTRANLGKDDCAAVDLDEVRRVAKKAADYRNDIDHGRGGNVGEHMQDVVGYTMYHQGLARLLILASLGDRGRDARGNFYSPTFVEVPE